ncbi:MAG: hypothetical protein GWN84_22340 [Gammaproteobacteria bacterium]|nr:hypothetical protein [Gammaproteobacteria bacterium]NIR85374.1 hypothetical protein [Gammaproteobacteria bacterium]NIR88892.1 hypothetical protein [Gammaproteobacteria bacterium]NIU06500.1 hypothetical protein [Gammaproteobacteria bacterium]NIV53393.1 hypothetical protein [Gammaproteobacteria bacterium]
MMVIVSMLFFVALSGCGREANTNRIQDPWKPEGAYKQERQRTQQQLSQLRDRLAYNQTDR